MQHTKRTARKRKYMKRVDTTQLAKLAAEGFMIYVDGVRKTFNQLAHTHYSVYIISQDITVVKCTKSYIVSH